MRIKALSKASRPAAEPAASSELRWASITTPKSWERYGIHALEGIYPILGPGFEWGRNTGALGANVVHFRHQCGADVTVIANQDMYGGFGVLQLVGTKGNAHAVMADSFWAFRRQLEAFVDYLRTGELPFPFAETVELICENDELREQLVAAGRRALRSRHDPATIAAKLSEIYRRVM